MASVTFIPSPTPEPVVTRSRSPFRKWGMLVVLSLALAIIILDTTILNVALSSIIRDLHTDIQKLQWVITAYSLTLGALTITGGRLGDLFGRKRMFVVGAMLFAIGSFLASISTNVGMLIAGEAIIEVIGAALMMPATASLLVVNFQGRERAIAFGVWGGIAGAAAALGPILGGYLTTNYNWRWGFRINLVVVVALLIGSIIIPESRDTKEKKELDWVGVLLSASGLLSLVFGIIEASTYGWWKAKAVFFFGSQALTLPGSLSIVPACILLGLVILIIFAFWEQRRERLGHTPLVSIGLFKNRRFTAGVATTAVMSLGQTGLIFALPVFLQSVRGFDAYHTGLALLPMSLALIIVAPLSAVLSKKISGKLLINIGLLINVVAYLVLRYTLSIDTTATALIPGLALFGIGMGLVMSQINNLTLSAVPIEQAGEASGVNNTLRQVGSTLGSAIIGTILIGTLGARLLQGVMESRVIPTAMKPGISQAMLTQTSNVEFGGGAQIQGQVPRVVTEELTRIGHEATVTANKESLFYGALFAILGFFVSMLLPSSKQTPTQVTSSSEATASTNLDTALVSELIQLDLSRQKDGKTGLGLHVRALIDEVRAGGVQELISDPRTTQARVLWRAGVGSTIGATSFEDYLKSLPLIPSALREDDARFPTLVLVDARISPAKLCALLRITPKGNAVTSTMSCWQETRAPYWIRCSSGDASSGKSVVATEAAFTSEQQGLTLIEGLCLLAQQPGLIRERYLDLAQSPHEGAPESAACLGLWNGNVELHWRWRTQIDPRCQTPSKKRTLV